MAAVTRAHRKPRPKVVQPGADWHGTYNGYSNHKCRCGRCKAAYAKYMADYRSRRFTGTTCSVRKCGRQASRAAGNGLCRHHHEQKEE